MIRDTSIICPENPFSHPDLLYLQVKCKMPFVPYIVPDLFIPVETRSSLSHSVVLMATRTVSDEVFHLPVLVTAY